MLHTIRQSPYQTSDLSSCSIAAATGDDILFYQDAVIAVQQGGELANQIEQLSDAGINLYVLAEDCKLRGVDAVLKCITEIDYAGFVSLVEKHETMYAW